MGAGEEAFETKRKASMGGPEGMSKRERRVLTSADVAGRVFTTVGT